MILIQLKEPPLSLFVKADYGQFIKEYGPNLVPYAPVSTVKGKKAVVPLKDNTNIAYIRESSDEEANAMMRPPERQQIETPGAMIIGKSRPGH